MDRSPPAGKRASWRDPATHRELGRSVGAIVLEIVFPQSKMHQLSQWNDTCHVSCGGSISFQICWGLASVTCTRRLSCPHRPLFGWENSVPGQGARRPRGRGRGARTADSLPLRWLTCRRRSLWATAPPAPAAPRHKKKNLLKTFELDQHIPKKQQNCKLQYKLE